MLTKQIGNVTVNFEPLIIFLVIIMVIYSIIALYLNIQGRKIRKSFDAGEYNKVLKDGGKLLKIYQKFAKRYKHKNTVAWIEYLNFCLAVSNFSAMNWDCFLSHINSISQYSDIKNFWLSLYYIYHNNLDKAQMYYDSIARAEENTTNISYLDCLVYYKQGKTYLAQSKMKDIYMKLKHPVLKQIVEKMFMETGNTGDGSVC